MKSLAELEAIRKATLSRINVRTEEKGKAYFALPTEE